MSFFTKFEDQGQQSGRRSSGRTVQPPGGTSSLQLGGYGGSPDEIGVRKPRKGAPSSNIDSYGSVADSFTAPPQQVQQRRGPAPIGYTASTSQRPYAADSLDDMVEQQNYDKRYYSNANDSYSEYPDYGGGRNAAPPGSGYRDDYRDNAPSSHEDALYAAVSSSRGGSSKQNGPLSGQEYAAMLRAQIATKASIESVDEGRGSAGPSRQGSNSRINTESAPNESRSRHSRGASSSQASGGNGNDMHAALYGGGGVDTRFQESEERRGGGRNGSIRKRSSSPITASSAVAGTVTNNSSSQRSGAGVAAVMSGYIDDVTGDNNGPGNYGYRNSRERRPAQPHNDEPYDYDPAPVARRNPNLQRQPAPFAIGEHEEAPRVASSRANKKNPPGGASSFSIGWN